MELSLADFQKLMDAVAEIKESNAGIRENQVNLQRMLESFKDDLKENDNRIREMQASCNRERQWSDYETTKADIYSRIRALEMESPRIADVIRMLDGIRSGNAELKEELLNKIESLSTRVSSLETAVQAHTVEDSTMKRITDRIGEKWWAVALVAITVICTLGCENIVSFLRGGT